MSQFSLMEMSYVLIEVFGLTSKQVEEVEKNGGLTDADIETEQKYVFHQIWKERLLCVCTVKEEQM